jgi:Holliday junction resolvasome RuvABC endonuclease subunit
MSNAIGLDLSITATGICDAEGACCTVGGPATLGDYRLANIAQCVLTEVWNAGTGTLVVIEDLAVHGPGNGMAAAQLMGAVKLTLIRNELTPYLLVPPSSLKKFATGKGNATKADMAVALYKRAGLELANDNEVDAWWLRALGLHMLGAPVVELPAVNLSALDKLTLPEEVEL